MQVEILNPEGQLFKGEADVVTLPGEAGTFQILNNHAPIISNLAAGKVVLNTPEGKKEIEIGSGVVEVLKNKIIVLV